MKKPTHEEIIEFIDNFHGAEQTFLKGCCYWFAWILQRRFGSAIKYDPVEGHFIAYVPDTGMTSSIAMNEPKCYSDGCLYDVRGDVTCLYSGRILYSIEWLEINEPNLFANLMRDCRDFIRPTDEELG